MTIFARRNIAGAAAAAVLTAALLCPPAVPAQEHEAHRHGGERLGRVVFPVSCAPAARPRFEHAMAVLHSFWWEKGDRAFGEVLAADSTCAMACWGLALNAWGNPFAGGPTGEASPRAPRLPSGRRAAGADRAGARLHRRGGGALPRRRATPNADRLQAYADTMARLYRDFPRDVEVAIYTRWRWSPPRLAPIPPSPNSARPSRFSTRCSPAIPIIPAWPTTSFTPPTHPGSRAWD